MTTRYLLAIDPGVGGGLAFGISNGIPCLHKMPDTTADLVELVMDFRLEDTRLPIYLEEIPKYTGRNLPSSSMAVLFRNYGLCEGIAEAFKLPLHLVRPQAWQKALGLGTHGLRSQSQWKAHLRDSAQRLYPELKVTLATADALLIWHAAAHDKI